MIANITACDLDHVDISDIVELVESHLDTSEMKELIEDLGGRPAPTATSLIKEAGEYCITLGDLVEAWVRENR